MDRSEILEKLKEILHMMGNCDVSRIDEADENSGLSTDLGLASVGMLYIMIAVEEFFQIQFEDVNFQDFQTVGSVIDYIEEHI